MTHTAYSELIKDFGRVRAYLREFFVYGFRSREEFTEKSVRSYDNERRRVESWLGGYMRFRQDENGRQMFLSLNSRTLTRNPMYRAFRAKSFTDTDLILHFCLTDMLRGEALTAREATDRLGEVYLRDSVSALPDESTVRKKMKEYEALGLLTPAKRGRETVRTVPEDRIDRERWQDAISYFSECAPLGVIGSYFPQSAPSVFGFKHRCLTGALDSEIMLKLLGCMEEDRAAEITVFSRKKKENLRHILFPLRVFLSEQTGRQYLLAWRYENRQHVFFRLDRIRSVQAGDPELHAEALRNAAEAFRRHLWGVSVGDGHTVKHLEMDVLAGPEERYVADRLMRERRCGTVYRLNENTWRFTADVYDPKEMLPWLRTFTGQIVRLESDDEELTGIFYPDLDALAALYGGDADAVQ